MNAKIISSGILRALAIVVAILAGLYFLNAITTVLVYIVIAAIVSLIGRPIALFLKNKLRFNRTIAAISTMAILLGILSMLIALVVPLLVQQGENLSLLNIKGLKSSITDLYAEITAYFGLENNSLFAQFQDSSLITTLSLEQLPAFFNAVLGLLGNFGAGLFSVAFISFFFLKDSELFENGILMWVPSKENLKTKEAFAKIKSLLSRYFLGLLFQILILFVIYSIVLSVFSVPNAMVIAFLCAL
ncbi:MAG: permease, partial [Polaribacter sp. BACL8 MAG-120419-bin8]